jgi:large subunit ribosomal protein L10
LAISKERKSEVVAQYSTWISNSKALILAEYTGLTMKQMDDLRAKAREVGGEFHVVKNTLGTLAFKEAGLPVPQDFLEGSTAIGFALQDAQPMAKAMTDYARSADALKIKGGYLGTRAINAAEVVALAEMPPLPVMRARLMGTLLAPASQLARLLAEPARQVAAVIQAHAESAA